MTDEQPILDVDDMDKPKAEPKVEVPKKDIDGTPFCRTHHCRMERASGGKRGSRTTYYKCPVPKCGAKQQKLRESHEKLIPEKPLVCPKCSRPDDESYCERDETLSTPQYALLRCPRCQWKSSPMPLPSLVDVMRNRPRAFAKEDILDR